MILGKLLSFSGPRLPHIWQTRLILKPGDTRTDPEDQPHGVARGLASQGSVPEPGVGSHPHPISLRGFSVTSGGQSRIFKPISIQTMW